MTLKEKFKKIDIKLSETHFTLITDREAEQCEKMADDYAIEFAEWLFDVSRIGTTKELLEIFKKEKGL